MSISRSFLSTPAKLSATSASLRLFGTARRIMSTSTSLPDGLHIENTNINQAPGVTLDDRQKTIVGSVLDLFAGRPSLKKFQLWDDDAIFEDPITVAKGRKQYETQFYGLQSAFSEIERLSHEVTNPGNPMLINLKTRYVIKGINKEQTIESIVSITTDDKGRISHLADKWNGQLPDGSIKNAFRRLNAESLPYVVSVPKNEEEDKARGNI